MYKSKEIRWFKQRPDKAILDWFVQHGQTFDNTDSRTDYYLPLQKEDIAIKLRESNIEIKQRIGEPVKGSLNPDAHGRFENWIKWSFHADKADQLSREIVSGNSHDWIEVAKTRLGIKIIEDSNSNLQIVPVKKQADYGCQVEYTLLQIGGKTAYTFALEWFGDSELQLPDKLINEILGSTLLHAEYSMGYGEYLR